MADFDAILRHNWSRHLRREGARVLRVNARAELAGRRVDSCDPAFDGRCYMYRVWFCMILVCFFMSRGTPLRGMLGRLCWDGGSHGCGFARMWFVLDFDWRLGQDENLN